MDSPFTMDFVPMKTVEQHWYYVEQWKVLILKRPDVTDICLDLGCRFEGRTACVVVARAKRCPYIK
jgi:hypothetical protein